MYKACWCILLSGLVLNVSGQTSRAAVPADAQAIAKLSSLTRIVIQSGDGATELTDAILAIAMKDREPTRQAVSGFSEALANAKVTAPIPSTQLSALQTCIVDVLRDESTSNFALAERLRQTLRALRVNDLKTDLIIRRFLAIGEAVRGPDDIKVIDEPVRRK
jgi:hypothetical protein